MNEKLKMKSSTRLKIARCIVALIFLFIILCGIEAIRGDLVKEKEETFAPNAGQQMQSEEVGSWL